MGIRPLTGSGVRTVRGMQDIHARLRTVLASAAEYCWRDPNLEDFLTWRGATLEYWVQMVFAATAGRQVWAARGETPLITACPNPGAKSNAKWADGALIWPDGAGAVLEVKSIEASQPIRARAIALDLAALLATDWPASLEISGPDRGVDDRWWQDRHQIAELWAVSVALVYGPLPVQDLREWLPAQLHAGLVALRRRFPQSPPWLIQTEKALAQHLFHSTWSGKQQAATMLAWAAPI